MIDKAYDLGVDRPLEGKLKWCMADDDGSSWWKEPDSAKIEEELVKMHKCEEWLNTVAARKILKDFNIKINFEL